MRIAVIGAGVSGSLAARLLASKHEVTLWEAADYLGGHANTVDVSLSGREFPVDTGFMVFNRRTYPNFCRLLELLEIPSQPSDMSLSVRCSKSGLEYQGGSLNGLFAQRRNLSRPSFLRMLADIARFNRKGTAAAGGDELADGRTVASFLKECRVGSTFVDQYLVPMAAAIWSAKPREILEFPAAFMLGFFANHGLMQLRDRPQWRTVVHGSKSYVQALLGPIRDRVRFSSPIGSVVRSKNEIILTPIDGAAEHYDQVIFATHADKTLQILADVTPLERELLGAFPYQPNEAVLHTDTRLLPKRRRAWASWNYHVPESESEAASVTYDLSRLQQHDSSSPILLTLNETNSIDPKKILRTFDYDHPAYSPESIAAQRRWGAISGQLHKTHFCGAYWGYGFHEDGVNSALAVTRHFGIELEECTVASTKESSRIVACSQ